MPIFQVQTSSNPWSNCPAIQLFTSKRHFHQAFTSKQVPVFPTQIATRYSCSKTQSDRFINLIAQESSTPKTHSSSSNPQFPCSYCQESPSTFSNLPQRIRTTKWWFPNKKAGFSTDQFPCFWPQLTLQTSPTLTSKSCWYFPTRCSSSRGPSLSTRTDGLCSLHLRSPWIGCWAFPWVFVPRCRCCFVESQCSFSIGRWWSVASSHMWPLGLQGSAFSLCLTKRIFVSRVPVLANIRQFCFLIPRFWLEIFGDQRVVFQVPSISSSTRRFPFVLIKSYPGFGWFHSGLFANFGSPIRVRSSWFSTIQPRWFSAQG